MKQKKTKPTFIGYETFLGDISAREIEKWDFAWVSKVDSLFFKGHLGGSTEGGQR